MSSNDDFSVQTFWDHVEELRLALIWSLGSIAGGAAVSLLFYRQIFDLLRFPIRHLNTPTLAILSPEEGMLTVFKTCLWSGVTLSSPFWLFFLLKFIAPALKDSEKRLMVPFFLLSLSFMFLGSFFAFTVTIPLANEYLNTFNEGLGNNLWTLSNYLNYTLVLLMANAVAFEACVVLLFLVHYGVLKARAMADKRRGVIVAIFVLSAILTPPDVLTQLMLALPLIGIYEFAIWYAKLIGNKRHID